MHFKHIQLQGDSGSDPDCAEQTIQYISSGLKTPWDFAGGAGGEVTKQKGIWTTFLSLLPLGQPKIRGRNMLDEMDIQ